MSLGYWITKCFVFRGILGGPLDKPCSVQFSSVVQNIAWARAGRFAGRSLEDPWRSQKDPWRVPGEPWGSLGGPQITRCSIFQVSGEVPGGPLYKPCSVQLFKTLQGPRFQQRWFLRDLWKVPEGSLEIPKGHQRVPL